MSEEKPDSLMSFMNISYEFIYRILEEFDLKRIETNARLVVCAMRSTPYWELRNSVRNYIGLENFCKKVIEKERHNQARFLIQARTVLPIGKRVGDFLYPFVCRLVGNEQAH